LIEYSPSARRHVLELRRHYVARERPEAILNLVRAIEDANRRISRSPSSGIPAPRPYPGLARRGLLWVKSGAYWFGYVASRDAAVVAAVFHETANIPDRL